MKPLCPSTRDRYVFSVSALGNAQIEFPKKIITSPKTALKPPISMVPGLPEAQSPGVFPLLRVP